MVYVRRKGRRCAVFLAATRLEGLPPGTETAIEVRWGQERNGLFPFFKGRKRRIVLVSQREMVGRDWAVEWEIDVNNASISVPDYGTDYWSDSVSGFDRYPQDVSFSVLHGHKGQVIGTANISLAEWITDSNFRNKVEETKRLPITLRIGYMRYDAVLYVNIRFMKSSSSEASKVKPSLYYSSTRLLDLAKRRSFANNRNDRGETENEESGFIQKQRSFFPWRRGQKKKPSNSKEWEHKVENKFKKKEFICREGITELKAQVFYASMDQRDKRAGGESACTVLVAFLANALISKNAACLNKREFDGLIKDGSSEWRNMCRDQTLVNRFCDNHFDLETVIEANIKPISVVDSKSFVGFFQPESFKSLCGATSFDDIWEEITKLNIQKGESKVYIVSWNDHFFVLKVETDAIYIVDTLGERLYEGCKNAYIIKFDDSSEMYKLNGQKKKEELIFRGKECCREYIKRFLAAIPLKEELEIEQKGGVNGTPHNRLQIEFHYVVSKDEEKSPMRSRYENDILREKQGIRFDRS